MSTKQKNALIHLLIDGAKGTSPQKPLDPLPLSDSSFPGAEILESAFAGQVDPANPFFQEHIRMPFVDDLCHAGWHTADKPDFVGHMLGALNSYVSRRIVIFAPDDTPINPVTGQLWNALDVYAKAVLPKSWDLGKVGQHLKLLYQMAQIISADASTPSYSGLETPDKVMELLSYATRYPANHRFYMSVANAFSPDPALADDVIAKIGALESYYHMTKLVSVYLEGASPKTFEMWASRHSEGVSDEARKKITTIAIVSAWYAQLVGVEDWTSITHLVGALFIAHNEVPGLMLAEPLGWTSLAGVLKSEGVDITTRDGEIWEGVGDNTGAIGNLALLFVNQKPGPGGVSEFGEKVYTGAEDFALADASPIQPGDNNIFDTLVRDIAAPYIQAIGVRSAKGYYTVDSFSIFPYVSIYLPVTYPGEFVVQNGNRITPEKVDRALRALCFNIWHRFYAAYPDAHYIRALLQQFSLIDPDSMNVMPPTEDTLGAVFPRKVFSPHMLHRLAQAASEAPVNGEITASSDTNTQRPNAPIDATGGKYEEELRPTLYEAMAYDDDDDDVTDISGDDGDGTPTGPDFTFMFRDPGPNNKTAGTVVNAETEQAQLTYLREALEPLYETPPRMSAKAMALAIKYVVGYGILDFVTAHFNIQFPYSDNLKDVSGLVANFDYYVSTETPLAPVSASTKHINPLVIKVKLEGNEWKMLIRDQPVTAVRRQVDAIFKDSAKTPFALVYLLLSIIQSALSSSNIEKWKTEFKVASMKTLPLSDAAGFGNNVETTVYSVRAAIVGAATRSGMMTWSDRFTSFLTLADQKAIVSNLK